MDKLSEILLNEIFSELDEARGERRLPLHFTYTLEKLKDDPDIYVSFRSIVVNRSKGDEEETETKVRGYGKIGIYPKSGYATPNGIYCYPLKEAWIKYFRPASRVFNVPYQREKPYIYVIKKKPTANIQDVDTYTKQQLVQDIHKLTKLLLEAFPNIKRKRIIDLIVMAVKYTQWKTPIGKFWNITRLVAANIANKRIAPQVRDPEQGEDPGGVYFTYPNFKESPNNNEHVNTWNLIFHKLGYDGFSDKMGHGIIHSAEPVQAVFLKTSAFDVIDVLLNSDFRPYVNASPEEKEKYFQKIEGLDIEKFIELPGEFKNRYIDEKVNNVNDLNRLFYSETLLDDTSVKKFPKQIIAKLINKIDGILNSSIHTIEDTYLINESVKKYISKNLNKFAHIEPLMETLFKNSDYKYIDQGSYLRSGLINLVLKTLKNIKI
jgi:hypothetical protein